MTIADLMNELNDEPWTADALCAQADANTWFPEFERGQYMLIRLAKRVCQNCPVRRECLEYALKNGEEYGVWGGLTEHELRKHPNYVRRSHYQPQDRMPCGTAAAYRRHHRDGETPCEACCKADSRARQRRQQRKGAA